MNNELKEILYIIYKQMCNSLIDDAKCFRTALNSLFMAIDCNFWYYDKTDDKMKIIYEKVMLKRMKKYICSEEYIKKYPDAQKKVLQLFEDIFENAELEIKLKR